MHCLPAHHPAGVSNKESKLREAIIPQEGRKAGAGELLLNSVEEYLVARLSRAASEDQLRRHTQADGRTLKASVTRKA